MKIVFLARYLPAEGSTTHMYSAALNLINRGNEVYLLSRGPGKDKNAINLFEKSKSNGLRFVKVPFPLFNKINLFTRFRQLLSYIFTIPFALFQLYKIKPDAVHAHYPVTTYIAAIYRFLSGKKFIVTHHIIGIPNHIFNIKANYVIAISREIEEYLTSYYKYKKNEVKLIFNGVPKKSTTIDESSNLLLKEKHNIPKDKVVYGFVGSVNYRKGIDILFKAFKQCKHLEIHLVVLGDGKIDWATQLINENQIDDMVTLIPFRDPDDIYKIMDILILPSRIEGFPLVPLEAMMMKKPVIRSNIEGANDQIIDGKNGYIFESENYLQLADIIKKIMLNPEVLIDLGENAYTHAINNFSEDLMIDKMIELYNISK